MSVSLLFVPIGVYLEPRIRPLVLAAIGFVLIYSLLPHKELRFIIYVFPVLNLAAACACNRFWINSAKSMWHGFLALCAGGHLLLNVFITLFLLVVSGTNYPGGVALSRLHRLEAGTTNVSLHIANMAAQSGISRFMQIRDDWHYCKNESIVYERQETLRYTHLLVEAKSKYNTQLWSALQEDFDTLEFVDCFNSIGIQYNSLLPVRIKTKPCIGILKRRKQKKALNDSIKDALVRHDNENSVIEDVRTLKTISAAPEIVTNKETSKNPQPSEALSKEDDDGIVSNDDEASPEVNNESAEQADDAAAPTKEINFQELRNLALGQATTRKIKATKLKIRKIIEQHYRSKGQQVESGADSLEQHHGEKADKRPPPTGSGVRQSVKSIIKQERIKEMIEQIATMDLTRVCDLDKVSTKDCLKQVIDKIDEASISSN